MTASSEIHPLEPIELIAYRVVPEPAAIRVAPVTRDWMDESLQRAPYRCLPMTIANSHGWEILCPYRIQATWNGNKEASAIRLDCLESDARGDCGDMILSHFGEGVVTFRPGYLFRTEPKYCLYVSGPINRPKDGISPLTGIVETDWLPYTFTMNWRFTRPATVIFDRGEPFCHVFPVQPHVIDAVRPEIRDLESDPELARMYKYWRDSRGAFINDIRAGRYGVAAKGWRKNYLQGVDADGRPLATEHRTRLSPREFMGGMPANRSE